MILTSSWSAVTAASHPGRVTLPVIPCRLRRLFNKLRHGDERGFFAGSCHWTVRRVVHRMVLQLTSRGMGLCPKAANATSCSATGSWELLREARN